ncbi:hypothetical protein [Aliarcobacter butzleri]|uniref:hypothetical protein n=1 Tax=Aliarcobacter butzleri TaxID=28197 RepID=UPI002B248320|nr:hypothetical protein [Aliarcobacter butzleri]
MIFRLFLFHLFTISLFANSVYNENILDIQAKVFPKIIIADNNLENKLIDNKIALTILYEDIDYTTVQILKDKIEKNYETLKDYKLEVKLLKYDEFKSSSFSTAYYFLLGNKEKIIQISNILSKNSRLSFAYDDNYLDFGVILGLKISQKIDIFLNLQSLKDSKIELQNSIFNLVKIK